jgi:hypothetical protein
MASTRVLTGLVIVTALAVTPLSAEQSRRRGESERGRERSTQQSDGGRERAVPRTRGAEQRAERSDQQRQREAERQQQVQRQNDSRQYEAQRRNEEQRQNQAQRQYQAQRQNEVQRQYEAQRRREADRRYDNRRDYGRPSYDYGRPAYSNRGYGRRAPRIIRPTIVTVIPYRPYVYRPRLGIGVYYGSGGSYPYGYTPRGYYDPIPGRAYGGLRITGAPRDAHVFADGYYVGIVNDFDGIFQHLNLEAGPHQIEIEVPGYDSIAFDVMVQPGRTTTFRADLY